MRLPGEGGVPAEEESWEAWQGPGPAARGNLGKRSPLERWDRMEWKGGGLSQPPPGAPESPAPPPAAHLGTQLDELRSTSQVA